MPALINKMLLYTEPVYYLNEWQSVNRKNRLCILPTTEINSAFHPLG